MKDFSRDMILAVREMLERHVDVADIASRMKVDISLVYQIIDMLT